MTTGDHGRAYGCEYKLETLVCIRTWRRLDRRCITFTLGTEGSEVLILSVQSESSWLIGLFEFESGRGLEIGYDRRSRAIRKYPVHMRQLEVGVRLV